MNTDLPTAHTGLLTARTDPPAAGTDLLAAFRRGLAQTPDAVAVTEDAAVRSYADLDRESARYAAQLKARGVGPETVVALVSDRCAPYVAMVLGVLRAGAAFVPVEPHTPAHRARQMCETAGVRLLFVRPGHEEYAAGLGPQVLTAADPEPPGGSAADAPPPGAPHTVRHPGGLAYVIFTSGSTGAPKGVMVEDAGMDNHIAAKAADLALGPADVLGFTAPLSFDISVWQCLTGLTLGAAVAVASPRNISEPAELAAWVRRHGVTVLEIVPSFLSVLVDELAASAQLRDSLGSLRYLIATGEALPSHVARRWYAHCPNIPVVNAYGPTECSDDVTHHFVTDEECARAPFPPIGREILRTRIHLVDADGRAVEPGEEGELLVGGTGVGRGYIADPVRTALTFVPDHLGDAPGRRLYRTGDRGARRSDGAIDFFGRRDRQVKVRGHRVELGDVEAQLLRVPGVVAAACVLSGDRLHAFVTGPGAAQGARVHEEVRALAPGYLVPHQVTVLERMPTNTSGKADHRALRERAANAAPPAGQPDPLPDTVRTGAAGARLEDVRAVVAEALGVPSVGPDDDFFRAGGDSLRAMTLVSRVRTRFDAPGTPLRAFLADPTPRGLHAALRTAAPHPSALTPGALSSGQERLWFLEQLHKRKAPQLVRLELTLRGDLDRRALQHALDAVVLRHEPLRTVFSQQRGVPVGTVWEKAAVTLEHLDAAGGTPAGADGGVDAGEGLSSRTARPPLMTAALRRTGPGLHVLALTLHHLVADGWSLVVLGREIAEYYQRWRDGDTEVPLPATTFGHCVGQEKQWLEGPEAAEAESYWTGQLAGARPVLDLPLDRERPRSADFTARHVVHELTEAQTRAVVALARDVRATPFMAVMAAFCQVLREASGGDDIVIGMDSVNRSWPGSEELIGTFVNQLPVRFAEPATSFRDLLELARRQCLGAYAHDRLPFHRIVAAVNPPRQAGRFPLFQVKVTQQSAWRTGVTLPDIEVTPTDLAEPETDLDLLLDVSGESDRLRLELVYRPQVTDARTADRWLTAVADVLRGAAGRP
ncbi:amino acid adenylation domain-containing protein [Streptomyces sp. NPDC004111]|uniref:amino acid adenylation domain-containing protein n=1 Tax=Streptomyces sp. NPDC004111 TaxID=3364690 RepID=UPI0036B1E0EC